MGGERSVSPTDKRVNHQPEFFDYSDSVKLTDCGLKQAWIHGPVLPELYQKYKQYGWVDIPKGSYNPSLSEDVCDLLNQVWESYGHFSADELEFLSHREDPWINARKGVPNGEPCVNEISPYEILVYYSGLK